MDDFYDAQVTGDVMFRDKPPVKVGDRFYINNHEVRNGLHGPIYNIVTKIIDSREKGVFYIEAERPQCTVGSTVVYSSVYFKNPDVVIERKGVDF